MTLIEQEFEYQTLYKEEIENDRFYKTPAGDLVWSVTTILDATKDKTVINNWRDSVGHEKADRIKNEASSIGTRMHKYLEDYVLTGEWPAPGSNPYSKQANNMAKVIKDNALVDVTKVTGSEISLYMPGLYAGTTDLVGYYGSNLAIMDFKQSRKLKKEEWVEDYKLQLVAYAEAHNELFDTNINEGHVFVCTQNCEYQQFDVFPEDYNFWRHEWYNRLYEFYENVLSDKYNTEERS